jgi:hypothetical protein
MIGWMVLGLLATAPAIAWAAPQPALDLRWEAPPGCPQESDVRDRIQNLLGTGRNSSHLRAEGTITRMDKRFRLDLVVHVRDLGGTRTIESNSCEDLAGAAAVEIALLVHSAEAAAEPSRPGTQSQTSPPARGSDSSGSRSSGSDYRAPQGTSDASASARAPNSAKSENKTDVKTEVASEAKEPPAKVASQRTWHALVQVPVLELGGGPLPQLSRGIGLSLGLEVSNWQLQVKGISWQRQNVPAPNFPGYGADVDRMGAAFWGCREFRGSWFGFSPCMSAGMERVSVTGTGQNIVQSSQHAFGMTAGAGAQGRVYLTSWMRLLMAVGGQIQLSRPQISVAGAKPADNLEPYRFDVYQFAPAALTLAVGLEWIL